ncbi:hypothetical protein [Viridibacillus arvi]|uniref:Uncharacterized protein n=1 Tax=Viridibacillus arvi TaxID=263475 RepID=A0A0M0LEM3_9BACL|nr:hypothetical protein [Viridibacillus arvi]KOO49489.1 hypothetical protein AMD00_14115 [Viridibacillus arvi]
MTKVQVIKNISNSSGELKEVTFVDNRDSLPDIGTLHMLYVIRVDITNSNRQTLCIWNGTEYTPFVGGNSSNSGVEQGYQQITKLGITASTSTPRQYQIPIDYTTSFKRAPLEILKFTSGKKGVVATQIDFNNTDSVNFIENNNVIFDGKLKLKTEYEFRMHREETWTEEGSVFSVNIDSSKFSGINKLNVY